MILSKAPREEVRAALGGMEKDDNAKKCFEKSKFFGESGKGVQEMVMDHIDEDIDPDLAERGYKVSIPLNQSQKDGPWAGVKRMQRKKEQLPKETDDKFKTSKKSLGCKDENYQGA